LRVSLKVSQGQAAGQGSTNVTIGLVSTWHALTLSAPLAQGKASRSTPRSASRSKRVFPVRLKAEAWNSGKINWLIDVIAPDRKTTTAVIANFKQVVKEGELRLRSLVTRLVDPETRQKIGAEKISKPA
jgi:hypothetical protein